MRLKNLTLQTNHQVFKPMSGFVADSNEFVSLLLTITVYLDVILKMRRF